MALTLASVETAIESVIATGQSVGVDGVTYTAASLAGLYSLRRELKAEAARTTRPTMRAFGFNAVGYGDSSGTVDDSTPRPVTGVGP
jgi:hypothetical protein